MVTKERYFRRVFLLALPTFFLPSFSLQACLFSWSTSRFLVLDSLYLSTLLRTSEAVSINHHHPPSTTIVSTNNQAIEYTDNSKEKGKERGKPIIPSFFFLPLHNTPSQSIQHGHNPRLRGGIEDPHEQITGSIHPSIH